MAPDRVISPVILNIYMNKFINHLKDCNIGPKAGNEYDGIFRYADDLTLINEVGWLMQLN